MPVSEATYQQVALEDPDGHWELICGRLREKPAMTTEHGQTGRNLLRALILQLPGDAFTVGQDSARLRISTGSYYLPDLCVIPLDLVRRRRREQPRTLEVYTDPMPLVVEIWSPSTGTYDIEEKLREYQRRGDLEIWRIHPYERTLTAWRRRPDGGYNEELHTGGSIQPAFLPNVTIDLASLFE